MTESTVSERIPHRWYARPVFFVSDVQGALRFYIDKLGFEKRWHEADGKGTVCQVNRGECPPNGADSPVVLCDPAAVPRVSFGTLGSYQAKGYAVEGKGAPTVRGRSD
jgi:hypothetical protein